MVPSKAAMRDTARAIAVVVATLAVAAGCTVVALVTVTAAGCSDQSASQLPPVAKPDSTRWWLRVANVGSRPIRNLAVVFPGEKVSFGDVGVGEVSAYRPVPNGVFPYAAFHYSRDGEAIRQGVTDWCGAMRLDRGWYTYRLRLEPNQYTHVPIVQIDDVTRDPGPDREQVR
jgi:hypothetical protein